MWKNNALVVFDANFLFPHRAAGCGRKKQKSRKIADFLDMRSAGNV